jgi:hypothetical protein
MQRNPLIPLPIDVIVGGAIAVVAVSLAVGAVVALVLYLRHRRR